MLSKLDELDLGRSGVLDVFAEDLSVIGAVLSFENLIEHALVRKARAVRVKLSDEVQGLVRLLFLAC